MKTAYKIALAKVCYRSIHAARGLLGLRDYCVVRRNGVVFDLDLSEGIDFAIFLQGYFEPSTARALRCNIRHGDNVIDIGANLGAHTLHMARHVGGTGRVFAFEPTAFAFEKLTRNLALNPMLQQRVTAYHAFLSDRDFAEVPDKIHSGWPLAGGRGLHPKHLGRPETTKDAACWTLDHAMAAVGSPRIKLIKLDVDGFECAVLGGARGVIARDRPTFVMEVAPYVLGERGASLEQLLSFFVPFGYEFFDEKTDEYLPSSSFNTLAKGEGLNIVARGVRDR